MPMIGGTGYRYTHITTSTTTTVFSGSGTLQSIIVNAPGTTWAATIYDNTSGSGTVVGVMTAITANQPFVGPIQINTGCTIVTVGATPGDLTVLWA